MPRSGSNRPASGYAAPARARAPADGELAADVRRRQFSSLLKHSPQAIAVLDADGRIREWNPAAVDLLGWTRSEMLGGHVRLRLPAGAQRAFDEVWTELLLHGEAKSVRSDGLHRDGPHDVVEVYLAPIRDTDGSFAGVVATLSGQLGPDPSAASSDEGTRPSASRRGGGGSGGETPPPTALELDDLTGLPGRRWLQRRLTEPVPAGQTRAAAVVDVDAFALVNQDYGPDAAEDVLRELAGRLSAQSGPSSVGRWQADTFVVVVDDPDAAGLLSAQVDTVLQVARQPFRLPDGPLRLSVSVGLADSSRVLPTQLFSAASAAMGVAKDRGRDCSVWYDSAAPPAVGVSGLRLASDLHRGLAAGELRLHFQPVVELATNDVVGVEALVRWQRPGVGLLQPEAFIELAERTGHIVALGEWVIRQACEAAVELDSTRLVPLRMSINVSARQLSDPGLVDTLGRALGATRCDPATVAVEVTETALLHDLGAATAVLEAVQALGVELDLDDFGTGYSSLLHLKHFPVSRIKIDRSFVAGLGTDLADTAIVASTIALAHSFGLTAIAEGVETPRQLAMLRQLGCDFAQGYLLCLPLPRDELIRWLHRQLPSRLLPRNPDEPAHPTAGPAAAARALSADERDLVGDVRDRAGDRRDDAADLRDRLADQREHVADRRDDVAASSRPDLPAPPGTPEREQAHAELARSATAREQAAAGRSQTSRDRELGAGERQRAAQDRAGTPAEQHTGVERRGRTEVDALTGAHLLSTGLRALQTEMDAARRGGSDLVVAHVEVTGPAGADDGSQLNEDTLMVLAANALGTCLRPTDLLIRSDATRFLCALPGLGSDEAVELLGPLHVALAGPPVFGVASVGYASLGHEPVEDLVARARAGARPAP